MLHSAERRKLLRDAGAVTAACGITLAVATAPGVGRLVDFDDRELFSGPVAFSARRFTLDRP
ncbi:hypothetical protein [Nonomuraea indica]|uniref:hypothetical protein n=1 Tax=Nonomuraea indica TaxID=1581193 RepID=UPI000C79EC77|nr:hypothetical protein [Nonomuraea indica]